MDLYNQPCHECKQGHFIETSIHDDWEGNLHCDHCGLEVKRHTDTETDKTGCFEGWSKENGNTSGQCCCNCKWQRPISAHPWNKKYGPPLQGSMMTTVGWGCTVPEFPTITFFEFDHGMCELHDWKKDV